MPAKPDKFDPYREALVIETDTVWPSELGAVPVAERSKIERHLHANPATAKFLEYLRMHTGFCRRITVTPDDLASATASSSDDSDKGTTSL